MILPSANAPKDKTAVYNPTQNGLGAIVPSIRPSSMPVPMTSLKGVVFNGRTSLGAVIRYCKGKEPDATTRQQIEARGDTIEIVDCTTAGSPTSTPSGTFSPEYLQNVTSTVTTDQGTITSQYNPMQFASELTAAQVASMLGGTVVAANYERFGFSDDQYMILINGKQFNAGLLADMIKKYGLAYTQQKVKEESQYGQATNTDAYTLYKAVTLSPATQAVVSGSNITQSSSGSGGTVVFRNTSRGNNSTLVVGDGWKIEIVGQPNKEVMLVGGKNGESIQYKAGTTDASGRFVLTGTATADQVGSWNEDWYVGQQSVGRVQFNIVTAQNSSQGSEQSHSDGGIFESITNLFGSGSGTGDSNSGLSFSTGGASFSLGGVSPWLLVGVGVGALYLFTKGRH